MYPKLSDSARSAVAVSVAALITAAALFGLLAPKAGALPLPLPVAGAAPPVSGTAAAQGPPVGNLTPR
ncbi:hypothetical protein ACGF7W_36940 [Streptomyces sp. NPDC048219]|uniref:hypothetical protein n=1 Tax=Streptomyces sp. NPDC048219 TaxID=3365517 RepID=UPI0037151A44